MSLNRTKRRSSPQMYYTNTTWYRPFHTKICVHLQKNFNIGKRADNIIIFSRGVNNILAFSGCRWYCHIQVSPGQNSWDTSIERCFFSSWPVFSPSQYGLSQLTHQILCTTIRRARRQWSVPNILTETKAIMLCTCNIAVNAKLTLVFAILEIHKSRSFFLVHLPL